MEKKQGSLKKAGLVALTKNELQAKIRERLASNYIFNLAFLEERNVMKFNTILNVLTDSKQLVKLTAAFEYRPRERRLRLITMF